MFTRLLVFLIFIYAALPALAFDTQSPPKTGNASAPTKTTPWVNSTVTMEVREPNGVVRKFTGIPWSLNMTVMDTMKVVDDFRFSAQWYKSLGEWMIISIDDFQNQEPGKAYWGLCVNGSPAGVGAGSFIIGPKASILWVYDSSYPPKC